ncbi:MAG: ankyrin repeat domain-containing protein [Thermoguttaceae bacterium]|nr:ankyrin repeat domain-containing protein [Thermoguttaceae bacterium]
MNGRPDETPKEIPDDWMTFAGETPNSPSDSRFDSCPDAAPNADAELGFAPNGTFREETDAEEDAELGFAPDGTFREETDAKEDAELGFAPDGTFGEETDAEEDAELGFAPNGTFGEETDAEEDAELGFAPDGTFGEETDAKEDAELGFAPDGTFGEETDAEEDAELGFAPDGTFGEETDAKEDAELGFAPDGTFREETDAEEDAELGFAPDTVSVPGSNAVQVRREIPFDPNWTDLDGNTPLHYAVDQHDFELVCELTAHGVPLNAQGHGRVTALERAAWNGDLAIVRHLVEAGAEINSDGGRWSAPLTELDGEFYDRIYLYGPPLYAAASRGHFEVLKYLISQGADINARDVNGRTVLHAASRTDPADCMQYLQALGAE